MKLPTLLSRAFCAHKTAPCAINSFGTLPESTGSLGFYGRKQSMSAEQWKVWMTQPLFASMTGCGKPKAAFWKASALMMLALCSSPGLAQEFSKLHAREPMVVEGHGGTMDVVDGIEIWKSGTPPLRYEVIGYIEDRRRVTGLINQMRLKGLPGKLAKIARANGGDAIVPVSEDEALVGVVADAYGAVPVMKRTSRFAVVKYLP